MAAAESRVEKGSADVSCTLVCRRIRPTEPDWAFKVTLRDAIYKRAGGRSGGTLTAADVSYLEGLRDMTPLERYRDGWDATFAKPTIPAEPRELLQGVRYSSDSILLLKWRTEWERSG